LSGSERKGAWKDAGDYPARKTFRSTIKSWRDLVIRSTTAIHALRRESRRFLARVQKCASQKIFEKGGETRYLLHTWFPIYF
jgi:hypothetical protein